MSPKNFNNGLNFKIELLSNFDRPTNPNEGSFFNNCYITLQMFHWDSRKSINNRILSQLPVMFSIQTNRPLSHAAFKNKPKATTSSHISSVHQFTH